MLVRVRTRQRTLRIDLAADATGDDLCEAIARETGLRVDELTVSRDPQGNTPVQPGDSFSHGDMVHLREDEAAGASAASGPVKLEQGKIVSAATESKRPEMTRWCRHGPNAACHHCMPGDPEAPKACNHGPGGRCPNCVSEESTGQAMEWLCSHPDDQMCLNCGGTEQGERVELEMLCLHGPEGRCTNCLPDEGEHMQSRAHVSFEEFLDQRRVLCDHAASTVCVNCIPPALVSYRLKPGCTKHKPWPLGLCNECQPPPVTLARQRYRHVDFVELLAFDEMARFVGMWQQAGMAVQRAALLYGTVEDDPNYPKGTKVVVQAVYEPPQEGSADSVRLLTDPNEQTVESVAEALGLVRVGWVFTHGAREELISSAEVRQMSRFQIAHQPEGDPTSHFVTMAVAQNAHGEVEPVAFMASDQAMALERAEVLGDSTDPANVAVREPAAQEILPTVLKGVGGGNSAVVSEFEVEFLLVKVNAGRPVGAATAAPLLRHSVFPVENRAAYGVTQSLMHVKSQLLEFSAEPLHKRVADFHLLVFLAGEIGLSNTLSLCERVREDVPLAEDDGLSVLLQGLLAS